MKKLLLLTIAVTFSFFAYANEATETTHDVRIEARNLGKGPDGKEIIHYKPIDFKHSHANHSHNEEAKKLLAPGPDAAKHDAKVAAAKPSFHTLRMTTKKGPDGKVTTSSKVIGHDNSDSEDNEKVETLFSSSIFSNLGSHIKPALSYFGASN
ncbi:MAG: hypothetical protein Q8S31_08105 [Alphaproteobacteria bacterium]|nr:hypothetical protein [Alphaproteobacteria bacterium]